MRYQISGQQIKIGDALQVHVQDELGEVAAKYAQRPTDANVIFPAMRMSICVKLPFICPLV